MRRNCRGVRVCIRKTVFLLFSVWCSIARGEAFFKIPISGGTKDAAEWGMWNDVRSLISFSARNWYGIGFTKKVRFRS